MAGGIYATRVTVIQNADGAGVELDGGNPVWVHSVKLAGAEGGSAQQVTFSQTTTAGGVITTLVGAISAVAAGGSDDWYPEAIFDKGFRVVSAIDSGAVLTITWRPCG